MAQIPDDKLLAAPCNRMWIHAQKGSDVPVCNVAFPRQIDIDRIELFTLKPAGASQLSQCMLGFDMQNIFEFGGRVTRVRAVDQGFGCIEQVAEPRKPHRSIIPQAQGTEPRNGPQCVVLASMRIAAQILQFCQLTKLELLGY